MLQFARVSLPVTVIFLPLVTVSGVAPTVALAARLSCTVLDRVSYSSVLRPPLAFHRRSATAVFQVVASLLELTCFRLGCGSMWKVPSHRACSASVSKQV